MLLAVLSLAVAVAVRAGDDAFEPSKDLFINGRAMEIFSHGVKPEWGYPSPQKDTFIVVHPKEPKKNSPLYVVLHSAGHDVFTCVRCTRQAGNHDIYHSPDDFYALYLDCRDNQGDWWWGGMHLKDAGLTKKNSGPNPMPVEKRVIDTVKWVMEKYEIDPNRVYLAGNSMGGSGTLGIGMRNGDLFAAIKANVPAGIEHVSNRMGFAPMTLPADVKLPDPPVCVDYSGTNDGWAAGHERFVNAMAERKFALYFYWGPFGHANNHAEIMKVNDLINSFDWLSVKKNEAYAVFTKGSPDQKIPWPDDLKNTSAGQINAFFRWKTKKDTAERFEMAMYMISPEHVKTKFEIPEEATADVTIRRIQNFGIKPGESIKWTYGVARGEAIADENGLITIPGVEMRAQPLTLVLTRQF
jgi:predicted esterase